jgi:hypothetical protein
MPYHNGTPTPTPMPMPVQEEEDTATPTPMPEGPVETPPWAESQPAPGHQPPQPTIQPAVEVEASPGQNPYIPGYAPPPPAATLAAPSPCSTFGNMIPDVYIDRVLLEESLMDTNPDPNVLDVLQTPKITISLKLVDQLSANGTYSLLEEALIPNSNLNLKEYFQVRCIMTTSTNKTEEFEQMLREVPATQPTPHQIPPPGWAGGGPSHDFNTQYKTLNDITSTYRNSDGNIELIAPYTFALDATIYNVIQHLTIFAYVQLDTVSLATDFNLEIPESLTNIIGRVEQELVIQNSQVVSSIKKLASVGITTVDEGHDHNYADLNSDGNGWTEYAMHPEEPRIKHRHEIIGGVVQTAQSWCYEPPGPGSPPQYSATSCEGLFGFPGVGPHTHELEAQFIPINNVQDFRIRDEISVLTAQFTSLRTELLAFPEQQDILAQAFAANSYLSELFVTKDADKNARFFFAFDYGKFCLESSKYANIISKLSDTAKQEIVDNSQMTRFIVSRRQVREEPAVNSLGSPVKNYLLDNGHSTIDTPVILSLDDENINEINLILEDQPAPGTGGRFAGVALRFFTGIDTDKWVHRVPPPPPVGSPSVPPIHYDWLKHKGMDSQSDGVCQYSIDIEVIDGFVTYMNTVSSNLSQAMMEYQKYVALTQIPDVYDVKSRKFTVYGQEVMAHGHWSGLVPIIEAYLSAIGNFIDLTDTINGTPKYNYYGAKIYDLINPYWGGIEGVLLFNELLLLISTQINNIMDAGYPGAGIEATLTNHPSNNTSTFQLQTMGLKEYFVNTIGARFINESYADNVSQAPHGNSLSTYTRSQIQLSSQTEVNLDTESNLNRTPAELLGNLGITYDVFPITLPTSGAPSFSPMDRYLQQNSTDILSDILGPKDLADEELPDLPPEVYASLLQQIVASGRESSPALNVNVDVLTGFVFERHSSRGGTYYRTPMMRIARFETKSLASLSSTGTGYYLCRQTRRSDVEVINSYFLLVV